MSKKQPVSINIEGGVLCCFQMGYWSASAKLDKNKLGEDVPKKIVRAMQDLLDDKVLIRDIFTVLRQARKLVIDNSMPFPIETVHFVPSHKVPVINDGLEECDAMIAERVDALVDKYDSLRKKFKKKYPAYYDASKYPTKRVLRNRYYIRWRFFDIGQPDKNAMEIDPKQYKREQDKFRGMIAEMEELTVTLIGNEILERIAKLHKQCESGEGLHGKTVNSINRLIVKWDDLWKGHVDNRKMKSIIVRLRKEMSKVSIDRLKNNEEFRQQVGGSLGGLMQKLEKMPDVRLKRKLDI